jgi:hypothetical protein
MAFVPNGLVLIRVRVQILMPLGRVSFVCVLAWFLYLSTSGVSSPEWQCRAKEPTRSANASLMGALPRPPSRFCVHFCVR